MWKVVIVEDEDLLRNGLIQVIPWETLGFEVVGDAENGKSGLEVIQRVRPQVVFTDIKMAQMDGLTMAEKIHEWDPEIQIVFISGYDEFSYAMRALKVGAAGYILKPIQLDEVKKTLEKLAETLEREWKQRQEYDKLKQLEEQSLDRVREEFYRSAIFRLENERKECSEEMLLPKEELDGWFCVMIVEQPDFAAGSISMDYIAIMEMDHLFGETLKSLLSEQEGCRCTLVHGSACERILVLRGDEEEKLRRYTEECLKLLEETSEEKKRYHVSKGSLIHGGSEIFQSYRSARKTVEARYQQEWDQIFNRTEGCEAEGMHFINYDKAPLIRAVRENNKVQIDLECANLETTLAHQKVFSQMHFILVVTSIFEELVKLWGELGQTSDEVLGKPMEEYQKIISSGKRSEILDRLKEYCYALGDCFGESGETRLQVCLKRAISYINQEYGNAELMMGDVAKHAYISSSYLSLLLKKETGKTFIEYLTDVRMKQAKMMLEETKMKNYEIAQACGFANATYFSTVFKSVFGVSPSAYRKKIEETDTAMQKM